jgi:hypothetical protein
MVGKKIGYLICGLFIGPIIVFLIKSGGVKAARVLQARSYRGYKEENDYMKNTHHMVKLCHPLR